MARSAQIKLSDVATSRVNNLNFMRFIAALMVIVSHCYSVVLGGDAGSYLLKVTGDRLSPGGVSVGVFFLFGGFLIARSCEHYPEPKKFFSARVCTDPQKLDQNLTIRRSVFLWQNIVLNSRRKSF